MKATLAILFLTSVIVGCASTPTNHTPPTVNESKPVLIDRDLLEGCNKPPVLESPEESALIAWISAVLSDYKKCSDKNDAHIQLLKNNFSDKVKEVAP